MGNTYRLQCKYEDALIQFQRTLDIRIRTLPKQHSDIVDCLPVIGKTLGDMDNPSEAIIYSMRALDMYNKTLPSSELVEKSSLLVDIGIAYSSVGVDELAIKYYRRALAMKRKCLP
jgi:tetratricopeptide (TPR) repeat protein